MADPESYYYTLRKMLDTIDPRIIKWTFMSSSTSLIYMFFAYIFFVYFAGPRFMKNRPPYSLKRFMQFYNIFQVIANFLIVSNTVAYGKPLYSITKYCDSCDNIYGHNTEKVFEIIWWTLLIKIIDCSETIVFVLRKKDNQISLFHVYHHTSTVFMVWIVLRYLPHAFIMTLIGLNSSVHVIMYFYYFLSTCGPNIQKIINPFKKWLTYLQMMHIALLMFIALQGLTPYCDTISRYVTVLVVPDALINLLFFVNFYRKTYKRSKTA